MQLFRKILIVIVATKDYLVHLELPDYQDWLGHLGPTVMLVSLA